VCLVAVNTITVSSAGVAGVTIAATTCGAGHVQAAINAAKDGDTVTIPEGRCTWTATVTVDGKAITIQGAGINKTVIVDNVPKYADGTPPGHLLKLDTKGTMLTRLTGMTFDGGVGREDPFNKSLVFLTGDSKSFRIDHVRFIATRVSALTITGSTYGVVDHSIFDFAGYNIILYVHHPSWNGQSFGDGSWADDLYLGTEKAVFIENNIFNATSDGNGLRGALDSWQGGRVVFRYNFMNNSKIGNHGSESSGRGRGARSFEIYGNTFNYQGTITLNNVINFRSGNGVIFDNKATGKIAEFGTFHHYRDARTFSIWGQCNGKSAWDVNDGLVYATGAHTGRNRDAVLSDSRQSWKADQWVAYSVRNLTQGGSSIILSSTATTLTAKGVGQEQGLPEWNVGDRYEITRATVCFDQTGRGKGALLSGNPPTPAAWPKQAQEPVYVWGNTVNNQPTNMRSSAAVIQEGRDFFNGTPMPGYTPYVYPHPLNTGAPWVVPTVPAAPTNLKIIG
jgi:hypothetical protein